MFEKIVKNDGVPVVCFCPARCLYPFVSGACNIEWPTSCKPRLALLAAPYLNPLHVIPGITRHRCFETWFMIRFQDPPQGFVPELWPDPPG